MLIMYRLENIQRKYMLTCKILNTQILNYLLLLDKQIFSLPLIYKLRFT